MTQWQFMCVEKLINDYVKLYLPQLQKIHSFSEIRHQTLQGLFKGPFPIEVSWVLSQLDLPKISKTHKIEK